MSLKNQLTTLCQSLGIIADFRLISLMTFFKSGVPVEVSADNPLPIEGTITGGATSAKQDEQTAILNIIASASLPDKETPVMLYRVKTGQSFTGASAGDPILGILVINTVTGSFVSNTPLWYNGNTKLPLVDTNVDTSKLEVIAANSLTASELSTMTLAISSVDIGLKADSQATDATSSWSVISLIKGLWTKLNNLLSSQTFTYVTAQNPSITASSTQSNGVNPSTNKVIITAMGNDAYILLGSNPTATVGGVCIALADGVPSIPLTVTPGVTKIAVIASSAGGTLNIVEYA